MLPADPVRASLGANASPALVEQKREELGYNDPLSVQYARFVGNVLHGDLTYTATEGPKPLIRPHTEGHA